MFRALSGTTILNRFQRSPLRRACNGPPPLQVARMLSLIVARGVARTPACPTPIPEVSDDRPPPPGPPIDRPTAGGADFRLGRVARDHRPSRGSRSPPAGHGGREEHR